MNGKRPISEAAGINAVARAEPSPATKKIHCAPYRVNNHEKGKVETRAATETVHCKRVFSKGEYSRQWWLLLVVVTLKTTTLGILR
jgi:hypothetical protein